MSLIQPARKQSELLRGLMGANDDEKALLAPAVSGAELPTKAQLKRQPTASNMQCEVAEASALFSIRH